jgi:hypothetical protein
MVKYKYMVLRPQLSALEQVLNEAVDDGWDIFSVSGVSEGYPNPVVVVRRPAMERLAKVDEYEPSDDEEII